MLCYVFIILILCRNITMDITTEEVQYLNELTIDKLLQLKNSLKDFSTEYDNMTVTTPANIENFGAQAMAFKAPLIKRMEYEGLYKKGGYGKISNIFSISVTTLAFLAFGGYLLCLIVQAVKSKQNTIVTTPTPTLFVNAGIKRPQTTFSSYGRRRRAKRGVQDVDVPPEEMFSALLLLCEGYAKWSKGRKM
ncbi:uncharacterized protein LOC125068988 [Vanessa atalanta]|uniref:uncharacterized protein LOC125068988 n=1 Tax=Vanessa atalanta TaxID=42275 RepID=UPI001FCDCD23|nr:uncharacterized protein LOC125068988 [Vanessa atalanta]